MRNNFQAHYIFQRKDNFFKFWKFGTENLWALLIPKRCLVELKKPWFWLFWGPYQIPSTHNSNYKAAMLWKNNATNLKRQSWFLWFRRWGPGEKKRVEMLKYSWRDLIRFSRGIGFSSNMGAYRIVGSPSNSMNGAKCRNIER